MSHKKLMDVIVKLTVDSYLQGYRDASEVLSGAVKNVDQDEMKEAVRQKLKQEFGSITNDKMKSGDKTSG